MYSKFRPQKHAACVYVARCGDFVKVGFSTHLKMRMGMLRRLSRENPVLLAIVCGPDRKATLQLEKDVHQTFALVRVTAPFEPRCNEWYAPVAVLLDWAADQGFALKPPTRPVYLTDWKPTPTPTPSTPEYRQLRKELTSCRRTKRG